MKQLLGILKLHHQIFYEIKTLYIPCLDLLPWSLIFFPWTLYFWSLFLNHERRKIIDYMFKWWEYYLYELFYIKYSLKEIKISNYLYLEITMIDGVSSNLFVKLWYIITKLIYYKIPFKRSKAKCIYQWSWYGLYFILFVTECVNSQNSKSSVK